MAQQKANLSVKEVVVLIKDLYPEARVRGGMLHVGVRMPLGPGSHYEVVVDINDKFHYVSYHSFVQQDAPSEEVFSANYRKGKQWFEDFKSKTKDSIKVR